MLNKIVKIDEDNVRKAYARWAPFYDSTFGKIVEAGRRSAINEINTLNGHILEVGVGTGISLAHYKTELEITGIDLSPEMLEKARKRVKNKNLKNIRQLSVMDAANMKFQNDTFDITVAMYVMTVVPDPVQVMRELERVTKPGGYVFILNHFSKEKGLRGMVEKKLKTFSSALGWRPEFPIETIMVCENLELQWKKTLNPFALFTLMRFGKK